LKNLITFNDLNGIDIYFQRSNGKCNTLKLFDGQIYS
jgi:hypothetical protein